MDAGVQEYIDGIDPANRPLFDRINGLILGEFPDAEVGIAYKMPVYRLGDRSLNVGAWKHGVSFYGWVEDASLSVLRSHPELASGKGTLRIPRKLADDITDDDLIEVIRNGLAAADDA
jgi:hypothetical protein